MAIDFPASPTVGQIFNASPGVSFVYQTGKWQRAPMKTALPKNYIVNPAMQISQQNTNAAGTVTDYYAADQWNKGQVTGTGVIAAQRVQVVTSNNSVNRFRVTVTTAATSFTSTDRLYINTKIEGARIADFSWGSAAAKQVVLRFGFKGPAGTYAVQICNSAANRSYVAPFTISAGQANTDTTQVFIIPGDITGTWLTDTGIGLYLYITLAAGTNYQSATVGWQAGYFMGTTAISNGMATLNNIFELFDVGLYADPYQTGVAPPFVVPDIGVETRRCQRYWYKAFGLQGDVGSATVISRAGMRHPVPMRTTPTGTVRGAPRFYDGVTTALVSSLSSVCNAYAAEFDVTTGGTFSTGGYPASMYYQTDNDYIEMNARM